MKILFIICFILGATSSFAIRIENLPENQLSLSTQIDDAKTNQLVVSFEHYNPKQLSELKAQLSAIQGIKQLGFCEKLHVFYFEYDASIYRNVDQAFDAILVKTKTFQPLITIGSSIEQVQIECTK
jgi:hypothetical protein